MCHGHIIQQKNHRFKHPSITMHVRVLGCCFLPGALPCLAIRCARRGCLLRVLAYQIQRIKKRSERTYQTHHKQRDEPISAAASPPSWPQRRGSSLVARPRRRPRRHRLVARFDEPCRESRRGTSEEARKVHLVQIINLRGLIAIRRHTTRAYGLK